MSGFPLEVGTPPHVAKCSHLTVDGLHAGVSGPGRAFTSALGSHLLPLLSAPKANKGTTGWCPDATWRPGFEARSLGETAGFGANRTRHSGTLLRVSVSSCPDREQGDTSPRGSGRHSEGARPSVPRLSLVRTRCGSPVGEGPGPEPLQTVPPGAALPAPPPPGRDAETRCRRARQPAGREGVRQGHGWGAAGGKEKHRFPGPPTAPAARSEKRTNANLGRPAVPRSRGFPGRGPRGSVNTLFRRRRARGLRRRTRDTGLPLAQAGPRRAAERGAEKAESPAAADWLRGRTTPPARPGGGARARGRGEGPRNPGGPAREHRVS